MSNFRPMSESDALEWEAMARSERLKATRARDIESRQLYLREADEMDAFAGRIRRVLRMKDQRNN